MTVPEINGKPAAKIKAYVEEKINVGNFSNVTIGGGAERYAEDTDEAITEGVRNLIVNDLEIVLAEERKQILEALGGVSG
jgi:hypothetical protein